MTHLKARNTLAESGENVISLYWVLFSNKMLFGYTYV